MADWFVRLRDAAQENVVGEYSVMQPECEIRNSEVGNMSCEIALGQFKRGSETQTVRRDEFAPYRTHWEMWRQSTGNGVCVSDGYLTSVNLQKDRDTILLSGTDWKGYLQRRIYPFTPEDYVNYNSENPPGHWRRWPKKWSGPAPIKNIVRDLLLSMRTGLAIDENSTQAERNSPTGLGIPQFTWNLDEAGTTAEYKIYPGDETSIYDHIQKLAEMRDGFEWDVLPLSREFRLWSPSKYETVQQIAYLFAPDELELNGAFTEFDWTNDGPDGTYLIGLGSGRHKIGATWTTENNLKEFGRYDLVYDYGEIQDYDTILQKLKDQNDLWPQKKLAAAILNPEFLITANFYTGGRPRSLLANFIRVTKFFPPYHRVDAFFKINAIRWSVDTSTNETVTLELEQQYEVETGTSGGIFQRPL